MFCGAQCLYDRRRRRLQVPSTVTVDQHYQLLLGRREKSPAYPSTVSLKIRLITSWIKLSPTNKNTTVKQNNILCYNQVPYNMLYTVRLIPILP